MKRIVLFTITTILFFSCKKDNVADISTPAATQLNVAYGADGLQKMDVYLPEGRKAATTKLIIMVHGGGWYGGDKSDITAFVDTLKKRLPDYAIININYRLATTPLTTFPTQENDVKAAVDFIYGKRSEYNISDKFAMIGVSAGAHLALLQSYKYSNSVKVKAVVDFFGPTDMTAMYNSPASPLAPSSDIALLFNGATPTTNATLYTQSSPITFANAQAVPTIILHGGQDPIVRVTQSTNLRDKLISFNIPRQYVFYPTEGHGWAGAPLTDSFDKIQAFLTQYVQ